MDSAPPFCSSDATSLVAVVKAAVRGQQQELSRHGITVRLHLTAAELTPAAGRAEALHRALSAVVENAVIAMHSGGELTLATSAQGADHVAITVTYAGPGLDAAQIRRYEGAQKNAVGDFVHDAGSRLPLLLEAQRALTFHQGELHVDSESGPRDATTVTLMLPR